MRSLGKTLLAFALRCLLLLILEEVLFNMIYTVLGRDSVYTVLLRICLVLDRIVFNIRQN